MLLASRSESSHMESVTAFSPMSYSKRTNVLRHLLPFLVLVLSVLVAQGLSQVPQVHGMSLAGSLDLCPGYSAQVHASFIDSAHGYAYFAVGPYLCGQTYGTLFKVRLSDFTVAGQSSFLNHDPLTGLFDPTTGFAYVGTGDAELYKVNITSLTVVAEIGAISSPPAVIDPVNGFAYFTCDHCIARTSLTDFLQEGVLTTPVTPQSAVIDVAHGFAYFAGASHVMKIRLTDFSIVNDTALPSPLYFTGSYGNGVGAIDPPGAFAYFGGYNAATSSSVLLKIGLAKLNLVSVLNVTCATCIENDTPTTGVIDSAGTYAYFQLQNSTIEQVRLSDFTITGTTGVLGAARSLTSVIDSANGFAYFPADNCAIPCYVSKVSVPAVTGHTDSTTVNCDPSPVIVGNPAICNVTVTFPTSQQ